MSRARAASRAAASNVTASLAALLSPARAEASRQNGAKSRGPITPAGKARASRNALQHGLRAERHVVVEGESPEAFAAFEAALLADLVPAGALQTLLAGRVARAAWRLERAERIEAELFARQMDGPFGDGDLGHALIRDGNGARAFDTLLRYRGAAQAEFARALRLLKALQAERAAGEPAPALLTEPDACDNPGEPPRPTAAADEAAAVAPAPLPAPTPRVAARGSEKQPDEPESRRNLRDSGRPADRAEAAQDQGAASAAFPSRRAAAAVNAALLAETALVPIGPHGG
jgi:hypothetical protein